MIIKLRFLLISTKAPDSTIRKKTPIMAANYYVDLPVNSPNARPIRTGYAGNSLVLSESKAYSDRTCRKPTCLVRIRGLFRQDMQEIDLSCPNTRLIQTGHAGN